MSHVFEGQPDGSQSGSVNEKMSRFRPRYRALTDEEKALHDAFKAKAEELEALYDKVKTGRYKALAVTSLEESIMWIVKELPHEWDHADGAGRSNLDAAACYRSLRADDRCRRSGVRADESRPHGHSGWYCQFGCHDTACGSDGVLFWLGKVRRR